MNDIAKIPYCKVTPSYLLFYEVAESRFRADSNIKSLENLIDNENKFFEISNNSMRRLRNKISIMAYLSSNRKLKGFERRINYDSMLLDNKKSKKHNVNISYKLAMITLTLPFEQFHSDLEIKKDLLNNFLQNLRSKNLTNFYIWKAEKQSNGNIHFHILVDRFVHYKTIRRLWNKILNKKNYGYIDKYSRKMNKKFKNGFVFDKSLNADYQTQYNRYKKGKRANFLNPNSTDVVAIKNRENLVAYLTKYIAKGVTNNDRIVKLKKYYSWLNRLIKDENTFKENLTIQSILDFIEYYKNQGVAGYIWNCSVNLSKLDFPNFTGTPEFLPSLNVLKKRCEGFNTFDLGVSKASIFFIDLKRFPKLDKILATHFYEQINKHEL